jgi:WD40-like Beta Propeller Repeat
MQRNFDGRLARLRLPDGKLEPFASGLSGAVAISVASESKRIVVALSQQDTDIWRLPGPKWPAAEKAPEPERIIASTYDDVSPDYSPDGKRIAFESARTAIKKSGRWTRTGATRASRGHSTLVARWNQDRI